MQNWEYLDSLHRTGYNLVEMEAGPYLEALTELMLPEAVLRLKQGFGRLIRRRSDRGAAVLLDHRIANRTYGQAFLDALPKAAVHVGEAAETAPAIARWLSRAVPLPAGAWR